MLQGDYVEKLYVKLLTFTSIKAVKCILPLLFDSPSCVCVCVCVCVYICVCLIVFCIIIPPTALVMERSVDRIARARVLNVLQKGTLEDVQIKIA